ncbi:MAG: SRPBCC domain-containing protein [Flavobacteriaceae bacterium]|nr:SRPBCC domain-containing protein [Flavobacteriaceae bacterium]
MSNQSFSIYHDFIIKASSENVFDAITLPEQLNNWWPLKSTGHPEVGAEYNLNFTNAYNWYGNVSEVVKNKSFFIKMTTSSVDWNPTTFGFELEAKDRETLVKFSHKGWPTCNAEYRNSSFCWAMLLNGLKKYVEEGIVIPFEERE